MFNKILRIFNRRLHNLNHFYAPWPTSFSTVDIAVVDLKKDWLLLGRKSKKDYWVFPGGFTEPSSKCDEEDAVRELFEETNLTITEKDLTYLGNFKIDDLRYFGTAHGIRTHFYLTNLDSGVIFPKAGDDLEEVRWFKIKEIEENNSIISPRHLELFNHLRKFV